MQICRNQLRFFLLIVFLVLLFILNLTTLNQQRSCVLINDTTSVAASSTMTSSSTTVSTKTPVITSTKLSSLIQLSTNKSAELDQLWKMNQMDDGGCIMTIASYGNRNMTLNWIASLKRINFRKFIVFCFDQKLADFLSARGYGNNSILVPYEWVEVKISPDPQDFRKGQFDIMVQLRVIIWYQLLLRNRHFLSTDTDVIFLSRHIYEHIKYTHRHSVSEVIFSQDVPDRIVHLNTGFFYVTPTSLVKTIFSEVLVEIKRAPRGKFSTDQIILNRIIAAKWLNDKRISVLDHSLYATGHYYFNQKLDKRLMNIQPLMVHANYIYTNRDKLFKLKERGLWYLNEMGEEKIM
jgi:hypothetical protein